MTEPAQSTSTTYHDIWSGFKTGVKVMGAQAHILNGINRVSVVCCDRNLSTREAARQIYQGTVDKKPPSIRHFNKGLGWHVVKESGRVFFKSTALTVVLPGLGAHYKDDPLKKHKVKALFAGGLSLAEMAINPLDTLRTMKQADFARISQVGKGNLLAHLYKGSLLNGGRQGIVWYGFADGDERFTRILKENTSIDPASPIGIVVKAVPVGLEAITPAWFFESLKNRLQCLPQLTPTGKKTSRVAAAFRHIRDTQGYLGFVRGCPAKGAYGIFLAMGALYQLEEGRKAQRAKEAQAAKAG